MTAVPKACVLLLLLVVGKAIVCCHFKGATKLYFTHYLRVVVILLKRVYVSLHFIPTILEH